MQFHKLTKLAPLVCVVALSAPSMAHHSFAMFDFTKRMDVTGTVAELQWTNPHVWVEIDQTDTTGKVTRWSIESASPATLKRGGWSRDDIKAGDRVTIVINPLRNGEAGGNLLFVTLPDGRVLRTPFGPPLPTDPKPSGQAQ